MVGSAAARAVLTLVIAVGMHLCCCRTELLESPGGSGGAVLSAPDAPAGAVETCCASESEHPAAGHHPATERHGERCGCESAGPRMAPEAPQHVALAPQPLLAVLPRDTSRATVATAGVALTAAVAPPDRRRATLLGRRCALIL
ncbi:MAG: hypothetical protein IT437_13855 [Phycisphaerales bacterium]|nr:hypothetical protein [Phycisphaerales bacterium]